MDLVEDRLSLRLRPDAQPLLHHDPGACVGNGINIHRCTRPPASASLLLSICTSQP
ncbi:MAG: hypothetical protein ACLUEU_01095 [Oscillospiraceae bacterium]